MKRTNKNADIFVYILLAAMLIFAWHTACGLAYNTGEANFPVNFNLFLYVASILGVCAAAAILFLLTDLARKAASDDGMAVRITNGVFMPIFLAAGVGLLLLIYRVYTNENTLFPGDAASYSLRQYFPHPVYFAAVLVPALVIYILGKSSVRSIGAVRVITALFVSSLSALYAFCPNPFAETGAGVLHVDAYTTTIINTARMIPFDNHHINIYGHHGICYLPLVKLLGGDYRAVALSICIFTFIAFLAASYAANVLIEKDLVYMFTMFAVLATTTLLTRRGVYYQINPHRLLFPMLALAYLAWRAKHSRGYGIPDMILQFIIAALAFVWNFETGLFTALIFAFCHLLRIHYHDSWLTLSAVRTVLVLIVLVGLSFASAVGIVDLYNIAAGGRLVTLREFIYPLFSGTYNVNDLSVPLPSVGHLYFLQILLFGFTILSVLRGRREADEDADGMGVLAAAVSLSGLSSMIYFINRPAYGNMSIAFIQMALLAGYGADRFMDREKLFEGGLKAYRLFRYALGGVLFFAIFWISIEGVLYIHQGIVFRQGGGWQMEEETDALELIRVDVPQNIPAFGMGVPQLYYELGWDPKIYPTDFPDMNEENLRYVEEEIAGYDAIMTSKPDLVPEDLRLKESYVIGAIEFGYYTK